MLRIILFISAIFLVVSCAPKELVKEEVAALPSPPPAEEVKKPPEPPLQKPPEIPEIKTLKRDEPIRVEQEAGDKYVVLNFDGADINTVVSAIAEMLKINYVLPPTITGKVTIRSHKKFSVDDLFPVFQTILEVNGLTLVRDGAVYKVVPLEQAKQQPLTVESGKEVKLQVDSSFLTQIVPLEYVKASDIVNIIRNLMPRGADLIVYEPSNILIVTAPPSGLMKFMKIVEALDIPSTERESIKTFVYHVENGEAKKLAEILRSLYVEKRIIPGKPQVPPKPAPPKPVTPAPSPQLAAPVTPTVAEALPGEVAGEVIITPYEDINALIIKTDPRSYLA
ncbi:MAG: hypothetical protein HZC12_08685, partial [Nitrospirae bacterium]|nr:hypothetical protein [Nitrospirota bacterium]